jgi:iron complex outermembrane recepter protein
MNYKIWLFTIVLCIGTFGAWRVGAQTVVGSGTADARVDAPKHDLEEIVVTARRHAEAAQSVPESITAYTAQDVKTHNITDQLSLANTTPSMVAISSGQPPETGGFAIRGQGPAFGATPGTIGYFSEVPNGLLTFDGRPGTYYDLASVQVLKGRLCASPGGQLQRP